MTVRLIVRNRDVVFSREFLKPSGQPLAGDETAKAIDFRGSGFLQIDQPYSEA
jgi:hypothetical protein